MCFVGVRYIECTRDRLWCQVGFVRRRYDKASNDCDGGSYAAMSVG